MTINSENTIQLGSIYQFASKWLFSISYKCGALISLVPGVGIFYRKIAIVSFLVIRLKFSKRVKRSIVVFTILSLGKQTFIMTSSIREVGDFENSCNGRVVFT